MPSTSRWGPIATRWQTSTKVQLAIAKRALEIDSQNMLAHAQVARQLVVLGEDGDRARAEIARVFDAGGAIVWTATRATSTRTTTSSWRSAPRAFELHRFAEAAGSFERHLGVPEFPGPEAIGLWRALGGCLGGLRAEADVSWSEIYEIKAGNYVIYFKFRRPVRVSGDRGKTKTLDEFKSRSTAPSAPWSIT